MLEGRTSKVFEGLFWLAAACFMGDPLLRRFQAGCVDSHYVSEGSALAMALSAMAWSFRIKRANAGGEPYGWYATVLLAFAAVFFSRLGR